MPGHIYSRLKRYEDAVWQQEASARVDHRNMIHDWVLPDQIHNFAHNNEWCIRNLIHVGRVNDALELANNMLSLPRHPKYNMLDGEKTGSSRYGRQRLFQVLSTFEMWDSLIDACHSRLLESEGKPIEKLKRLRFLGRAYFRSGERESGEEILSALEQELCDLDDSKNKVRLNVRNGEREANIQLSGIGYSFHEFCPRALSDCVFQQVPTKLISKSSRASQTRNRKSHQAF